MEVFSKVYFLVKLGSKGLSDLSKFVKLKVASLFCGVSSRWTEIILVVSCHIFVPRSKMVSGFLTGRMAISYSRRRSDWKRCKIFVIIKTDYMSREVIKWFAIILSCSTTLPFFCSNDILITMVNILWVLWWNFVFLYPWIINLGKNGKKIICSGGSNSCLCYKKVGHLFFHCIHVTLWNDKS